MRKTHIIQIGDSRSDSLCEEARKLIAGGALPTDRLEGWRGSTLCLSGGLGWFAERRISETSTEGPYFVKWKPYPKGVHK